MRNSCPISSETLDERVIRLVAFQIVVLTSLALWNAWPWLLFAQAVDFGLRSHGLGRVSPLAAAARLVRTAAGLAPLPVNAGPKQFAARIGGLISLSVAIGLVLGWRSWALALGGVLILCACLEAFFGYCVGCRFYQLWVRLRYGRP